MSKAPSPGRPGPKAPDGWVHTRVPVQLSDKAGVGMIHAFSAVQRQGDTQVAERARLPQAQVTVPTTPHHAPLGLHPHALSQMPREPHKGRVRLTDLRGTPPGAPHSQQAQGVSRRPWPGSSCVPVGQPTVPLPTIQPPISIRSPGNLPRPAARSLPVPLRVPHGNRLRPRRPTCSHAPRT